MELLTHCSQQLQMSVSHHHLDVYLALPSSATTHCFQANLGTFIELQLTQSIATTRATVILRLHRPVDLPLRLRNCSHPQPQIWPQTKLRRLPRAPTVRCNIILNFVSIDRGTRHSHGICKLFKTFHLSHHPLPLSGVN